MKIFMVNYMYSKMLLLRIFSNFLLVRTVRRRTTRRLRVKV